MKCPQCGRSDISVEWQVHWIDPTELLGLIEKAQQTHHADAAILHLVKSCLSGDPSALKALAGVKE